MIVNLQNSPQRSSQHKSVPAIQRTPTNKYTKGSSSCWFFDMWRRWGILDRALFVVVIFFVAFEIYYEVGSYRKKAAGEEGAPTEAASDNATSDNASSAVSSANVIWVGAIACVVGGIAMMIWACLRFSNDRRSNSSGFQRRDRNASSNWFVATWQRWGFVDRVLFVLVCMTVVGEIIFEINKYKEAGGEGEGNSASEAAPDSSASDSFLPANAIQVGAIACVVGVIVVSIWACLRFSNNRRSNSAGFQLRDRNASRKPGINPCKNFFNWWQRSQLFDKVLVVCVVLFVCIDGATTLAENGLPKVKVPNLRGSILFPTDAPTASPTPVPPPPPEDPKEVAAAMKSAAASTYAHVGCTPAQIGQVQSSGITGDACRGKPYTQSCSFSQMTNVHKASWLGHFAEEVRDARAAAVNTTHTFLGFMAQNDASDCVKIDNDAKFLQFMFQGPPDEASDNAVQAGKDILKSPKLFCTKPYSVSDEFEKKWGLSKDLAIISKDKTFDQFMIDNSEAKEIKDVVHITEADNSFNLINGGWVTLARTRYVEFPYDWQGSWTGGNLETVINKLNELGHTCYWPGDGKLWRITDCWQPFYGFKSYSNVACVNRYLAPKLAEAMEKLFLKTIEAA